MKWHRIHASLILSAGKTRVQALSKKAGFPIVGSFLLIIAAFISMYWTLVGIERTLHGFNWALLGIFGVVAFAFGLVGSVMAKRRKHFALTVIAACFPLAENTVVVRYSFDNYQLTIPWIAIALAFVISTLSGIFIGISDDEFS
jgi:uncharacterized membrane protein